MIAIKARGRTITETALGSNGSPVTLDRLAPEGLEAVAAVEAEPARAGAVSLWFVPDDAVAEADARRARPADVPVRDDLPASHPLRGKRVLRVVPAGWPDATLDARGRLVPVDPRTGEPLTPAEPPGPGGHEEPGDLREAGRG